MAWAGLDETACLHLALDDKQESLWNKQYHVAQNMHTLLSDAGPRAGFFRRKLKMSDCHIDCSKVVIETGFWKDTLKECF